MPRDRSLGRRGLPRAGARSGAVALAATLLLCGAPEGAAAVQEAPPAPAPPEEPPPAREPPPAIEVEGDLHLRYRFRSIPGEWRDQDLFGSFGLDARLPRAAREGLRLSLSGSFVWDLDTFRDGNDPLNGLPETFPGRFKPFVYEGYGEWDPGGALQLVRLGRQVLWREEGIRYDGFRLETTRSRGIEVALYGGVPVHLYESSPKGDLMGGLGLAWRPGRAFRLALDEIYVRDRRDLPGVPSVEGDVLSVLSAEWRPHERWTARGSFSMLDAKERRQSLEILYVDPEAGFRLSGRALRQNDYTDIPVTDFSPFVSTLGAYSPYLQWQIDASKTLFSPVEVGAGVVARRLIERREEGPYNHEFNNGYVSVTLSPFPVEGALLSFRADGWDAGGRDFGAVGAHAEKRFGKTLRLEAGTDYALYRVDLLTGDERFRNRQYYGRVRWKARESLDLGLGYRHEVDSLDRYHVAEVTCGIRF